MDGGGAGALAIAGAPAGATPAPLLCVFGRLGHCRSFLAARLLSRAGVDFVARRRLEGRAGRDTKSEFRWRKRSDRDIG